MRTPAPKKIADNLYSIRLPFNDPTTAKRRSHIIRFEGTSVTPRSSPGSSRCSAGLTWFTTWMRRSSPSWRSTISIVGRWC